MNDNELEFMGFLPKQWNINKKLQDLALQLGTPLVEDELVIFFKKGYDLRLRICAEGIEIRLHPSSKVSELHVVLIQLDQAEKLIRLLSALGYHEALFSRSKKYSFRQDDLVFYFKLNSIPGDFWHLLHRSNPQVSESQMKTRMTNLLNCIGLHPWEKHEYKKHLDEVWAQVPLESLLEPIGDIHPKIREIVATHAFSHPRIRPNISTIAAALRSRSNEFSEEVDIFFVSTGFNLLNTEPTGFANAYSKSLSIIVPTHNSFDRLKYQVQSITNQRLHAAQFETIEVTIVDDGSSYRPASDIIEKMFKPLRDLGVRVNVVRTDENIGRAKARNIGIAASSGDIILFLDSDIALDRHYIAEIRLRHEILDDIVLVGFKENLPPDKWGDIVKRRPDTSSDFRIHTVIGDEEWIGLHHAVPKSEISCLKETDHFRQFGLGRTIGPFDLPCMVVSNNVSVSRVKVEAVGGFAREFGKFWGFEDTYLGACLISSGCKVVPLLSSGVFHLDDAQEIVDEEKVRKLDSMRRAFVIYRNLLGWA